MRQGSLCLLFSLALLAPCASAQETTPTTAELVQRIKDSDGQREALNQQLQVANTEASRLRQENQRLKQQIKHLQANVTAPLLSEQQEWFVLGGAVALFAALCGIFASGGHRRRRQWLN